MKFVIKLLGLLIFISLLIGCSVNKNIPIQTTDISKMKNPYTVAGVDSALSYHARNKSERLFVNLKSQHVADSLLNYGQDFLKITEELYEDITNKEEKLEKDAAEIKKIAEKMKEQQAPGLEDSRNYEKMKEQFKEDSLTIAVVTSLLEYFINHCEEAFGKAHKLNLFNLRCYQLSARGNWDKGLIFDDTTAHKKAVNSLMKFWERDRGYPFIYRELGKNYYQLQEWEKSYNWLFDAIRVLKITAEFEEKRDSSQVKYKWLGNVDPFLYYEYAYDKARAEIKMYMEDSARISLQKAYALAPDAVEREKIENIFEWINWDDGNIKAAEIRDEINDTLRNENYTWARQAYLDLIPQLRSKLAKDNVIWRLAKVEYLFLKDYETAANRLYQVVSSKPGKTNVQYPKFKLDDKERQNYEARTDSLSKEYAKDCGQMFYDIGIEYQKKGLFAKARSYFVTDTTIDWPGRAKSFLYLAQLSRTLNITPDERKKLTFAQVKQIAHRNNLLAIKLLNRMLQFKSDLEKREIEFAYGQLIDLWKEVDPKRVPGVFQEYQRYVASLKANPSN